MSLWIPTSATHGTPEAGDLVAVDAPRLRYKPWRIASIAECDDGSTAMILREPDAPDLASSDKHHVRFRRSGALRLSVWKLADRHALCSCCGDLMPCRHETEDRAVKAITDRFGRYETAGVCPACGEVVTDRQKHVGFDTNLYVPLGPPVTFHLRKKCIRDVIGYDAALAKREGRPAALSCQGLISRFKCGRSKCTSPTCPGPDVAHWGYRAVDCSSAYPCDACRAVITSPRETR